MKFLTYTILGFVLWPIEALFAMVGCSILSSEGFLVPTPGYLSCFWVVVGGELLIGAVSLTRETRREMDRRADR